MMLTIHIGTLIVVLISGHIVTGLMGGFFLARRKKDSTFYTFLLARFCDALAWGLLSLKGYLSNRLSMLVGGALLILGSAFQIIAFFLVKERLTLHIKRICYCVTYLFLFLLSWTLHLFHYNDVVHMAVLSFSLAGLWSIPCYYSFSNKSASSFQKFMSYVYGVWIIFLIFKTFEVLYFYVPISPITDHPYHILFFLWQYVVMMVGNIGLILLSKEKTDRQLTKYATYDELTDLYNRRAFFIRAKECLSFCTRHQTPVTFFMMDLDNFKKINDKYGHMVGDIVLKHFASTLKKQLRGYDILGRIGGEEFTALLPGVSEKEAYGIAQRLRNSVAESVVHILHYSIKYTVSIGITSVVPTQYTTIEQLYRVGDQALYQAKQNGRNQVVAANLK